MLQDSDKSWIFSTNDQLMKADAVPNLIVAYRNGAPVRLSDVATVSDSYSNIYNAGSFNGKPSVLVVIFRQPGANIIATVDRVIGASAVSAGLDSRRPSSWTVGLDRTITIRASVDDVERTLLISVILVVLVVFLFLREVARHPDSQRRGAAVAGRHVRRDVPVRLSLDNLSLMALTISTGFVVDDAIVVMENIMRHIEDGHDAVRGRAAGRAGDRLHRALDEHLADRGVHPDPADGRHRRAAVPRVRRHLQRCHRGLAGGVADHHADAVRPFPEAARSQEQHGRLYRASERGFDVAEPYVQSDAGLGAAPPAPGAWRLPSSRSSLNVYLYIIVPKGFFPQQDTGRICGIMGDQDVSFEAMKQKLDQFIRSCSRIPAVQNVLALRWAAAAPRTRPACSSSLKPLNERKASAPTRSSTACVPSWPYSRAHRSISRPSRTCRSAAACRNAQYQYTLSGDDLDELNEWAPQAARQSCEPFRS